MAQDLPQADARAPLIAGAHAVTAKAEARFRSPARVGMSLVVRGRVVESSRRILRVHAEIRETGELGQLLAKTGRYEEAVADLNVAISMFPHRLYYYHRGLALKGMGRDREADEDFVRAGRAKGQMHWFAVGSELS